ncbi:MAG: Cys-tRNA(Pro) deacylase [Aquimonas sp.]|nr:Cys-tRNA(Pro) deacylase [Aquimonas sp.]
MSRATPATRMLDASRIAYRLHTYAYDPEAANIGLQAAAALGIEPARMLKTLMVELDGKPACAILPVDHVLSLKKLATALGGKHAVMLPVPAAERITGYHVGGISPFGQKKRVPVALEQSALDHVTVYCNGGQRGLQIELDPRVFAEVLGARAADLLAAG